eukprot:4537087-Alexandrium_andersonii.AAC.1
MEAKPEASRPERAGLSSQTRDRKFSHDLQHFDDQGRTRQPGVGPKGQGGAKGVTQADAPAGLQPPPAGSAGSDQLRNPFDAGMRSLSQPAPGEREEESRGTLPGARSRRAGARRRRKRGKGSGQDASNSGARDACGLSAPSAHPSVVSGHESSSSGSS